MDFPASIIIPNLPTSFTTTIPDMLSGGTVELIFTRQVTVESFSNTWSPSLFNPAITTNFTYAISGSIGCGGTDLKLAYNLRVVGEFKAWSGGYSNTTTTTNDGTELNSFGTWVVGFVSQNGS